MNLLRLLILGLCFAAADTEPAAGDAPAVVFGPRLLGDGIRSRNADPNDDLYPININNAWGLMNQHGWLVIWPTYDWADYSYHGLTRVVMDGRTGFISHSGRWIVQPVYRYADRFEGGFAVVGDGRKFGYIDALGNVVHPIELDGALRFREGMAGVRVGQRCGFIDSSGRIAIPTHFLGVRSFHEGLAAVELLNRRRGYIDRNGEMAYVDAAGQFSELGDFNEGLARVRIARTGKWGYINRKFELCIDPIYDDAQDFAGGLAAIQLKGKWGYIDKEGEMAIGPRFDQADGFREILAMVKVDGKYGYINRRGEAVIRPQFDAAQPYFRNFARVHQRDVMKDDEFGYITVIGQIVWDPRAAHSGIIDMRGPDNGQPRIRPPAFRRGIEAPYPPDHEYVEQLPRPRVRRW